MVRLFGFLSRAGDLPRKFNGNGLKNCQCHVIAAQNNIFLRETNCVIHRIGIYSVVIGVIHPLINWGLGAR